MPVCETCGNDYDKTFKVVMAGKEHTFDSFECAVHALAPKCKNCGCRILGHGLENDGTFLLRSLRRKGWREGIARPSLTRAVIGRARRCVFATT